MKFKVGDHIGDGWIVTAITEAVGRRGPMCWCAPRWLPEGRADFATFRPGEPMVHACHPANPFTVRLFHETCVTTHQEITDPVIQSPWGVKVTGVGTWSAVHRWEDTRAETREWLKQHPEATSVQWMRRISNDAYRVPGGLIIEDPNTPLCETNDDMGVVCMSPALYRMDFTDGPFALVCPDCRTKISAAVPWNLFTVTDIRHQEGQNHEVPKAS